MNFIPNIVVKERQCKMFGRELVLTRTVGLPISCRHFLAATIKMSIPRHVRADAIGNWKGFPKFLKGINIGNRFSSLAIASHFQ